MKKQARLKKGIDRLILTAKQVYPDVKYRVLIPGMDGDRATIEFFSPRKYEDKLDDALVPVAVDILLKDRYLIGVLTFTNGSRKMAS